MLDAVVVGAGFGGLAAALELARGGARVAICEALAYPGGCAATFRRRGFAFEAGATLFAGFERGQLFGRWLDELGLPVRTRALEPAVELRAPGLSLPLPASRERLMERLCAIPDAPAERVRAFFAEQGRAADALWALFDDPGLFPPLGPRALLRHLARAPRYLPLLSLVGRPLAAVLARHGLERFAPLRLWADALCQITVQASAAEAEAPFALAALDYLGRGARHVEGGIGALAWALLRAAEARGAEVLLANRVRAARREGDSFIIETRRGELHAKALVLNLLPRAARELFGLAPGSARRLDALSDEVERGWGAAMLYFALPASAPLPEAPHHLQLVFDPARPLRDGNHVFCSVSGASERDRGPRGERTVTASTHVALPELLALPEPERAARIAAVQAQMQATLAASAPELCGPRAIELPASPRTFARFTGRPGGFVGGIPRRAGLQNYRNLFAGPILPGVHLVGDSVFPGQSTLAVALGGVKAAQRILGGG